MSVILLLVLALVSPAAIPPVWVIMTICILGDRGRPVPKVPLAVPVATADRRTVIEIPAIFVVAAGVILVYFPVPAGIAHVRRNPRYAV